MRLTSIELENFRCFEKEKIDLHPQLNVFVGLNASGKTALLEGMVGGLSRFLSLLFGYPNTLVESDFRQATSAGISGISSIPSSIKCIGKGGPNDTRTSWDRKLGVVEGGQLSDIVAEMTVQFLDTNEVEFPVLLYFSTQRNWGGEYSAELFDKYGFGSNKRFSGYFGALGKLSNTSFFEKELDREQKAAQQSKELGYNYDSSRLNLVRVLAGRVIEDCEIFYYDYDKESLAVMFKDGRRLRLNELSDGQKSLLLISTGIAFQCATLNPHMGLDAYKSNGVVLIDEVELHLHPDWQRQILPILSREFPNIQFICTTHSPQVVSTLKPENVQVIKDFKVTPLQIHTEGRDSNTILTEVFGIEKRPKEFGDKLQHFYSLLEKHAMEEAKVIFEDLQDHWGTLDTEIVRARHYLEDLEEDLARAKEVLK